MSRTEWLRASTPYEVLQISPSSSVVEVRAAFKRWALRTHPDKQPTDAAASATSFHAVKEAAELLMDPMRRGAYDAAQTQASIRTCGAISDTYELAEGDFEAVEEVPGADGYTVYQRECRCGGTYEFVVFAAAAEAPGNGGEEQQRTCCECDTCSLVVEVLL